MTKAKPTKKQLEYLDWEIGIFFHFGIRSFEEGENYWKKDLTPLEVFNPTELDCEQWIRTISEAGAKYAILTVKHHDGFANWPTAYSDYSVANTPWKDGKGDVVREFTDACRKYNVKIGLYYSPAQVGYTEMSGKEYDDYFINQITEILTNYGKIDYIWFDGCGSEHHTYDKDRIVKCIRTLQPEIMIFSMWDPDTRWVANEEGIAPIGIKYEVAKQNTSINLQEEEWLDEPRFLPYECDCKMSRYNWFYSDTDEPHLRSAENIMGLYDYSVGRGGNLLMNIAPDRRGLLPDTAVKNFKEFGENLKKRFAVSKDVDILDKEDGFEIHVKAPTPITTIVVEEDLTEGQAIFGYQLIYGSGFGTIVHEGKTIGHKQIITIPEIYLDPDRQMIFKVTEAEGEFKIKSVEVY